MYLRVDQDTTPEDPEFRGAVLHQFGHVLGCLHEHQSPAPAGIECRWDKGVVYRELKNPPYNWHWTRIWWMMMRKYDGDSKAWHTRWYDPESVMVYKLPRRWLKHEPDCDCADKTKLNTELSYTDKEFISSIYP